MIQWILLPLWLLPSISMANDNTTACNADNIKKFDEEAVAELNGEVLVRWIPGDNGEHRLMVVEEPITFKDPQGIIWRVEVGDKINGASLPKPIWSIAGSPYVGEYRMASVIHDVYSRNTHEHQCTYQQVHRMFLDALLATNVKPHKAWAMYAAVAICGPTWEVGESRKEEETIPCADNVYDKAYEKLAPFFSGEVFEETEKLVEWIKKYSSDYKKDIPNIE